MIELGQRHPFATLEYAGAFGGDTKAIDVPAWNSVVLAHQIPSTNLIDASGCYPLTPLAPDANLADGLAQLRARGLLTVVLVTDPLCVPSIVALEAAFDFCRAFKTHYAFDRSVGPIDMSRRCWREVRIARASLRITQVVYAEHIEKIAFLYSNLVEHHGIEGVAAFDERFFDRLRYVSGIRAIAAFLGGEIVSVMLFVVDHNVAYAFLAGTSAEGRARCAHYGLYAEAIETFTDISVINLGGAPGFSDNANHGIAHVKRKLTNATLGSYLCGAILDRDACAALGSLSSSYFPPYRAPPKHVSGE